MKQVYIAGVYERRVELLKLVEQLPKGWRCNSTWLNGSHDERSGTDQQRARYTQEDYIEVCSCDMFVLFTELPYSNNKAVFRGGRHVELGLAYACGKRILIVGPRENIFCWLPEVEVCNSWEEVLKCLSTGT